MGSVTNSWVIPSAPNLKHFDGLQCSFGDVLTRDIMEGDNSGQGSIGDPVSTSTFIGMVSINQCSIEGSTLLSRFNNREVTAAADEELSPVTVAREFYAKADVELAP